MDTSMSKELAPQELFQDKLCQRLRADIGDLLPDEALKKLVDETIQRTFFTRGSGQYGRTEDSWFEKEVKSLMKPLLEAQIQEYMKVSQQKIIKQCVDTMTEQAPLIIGGWFATVLNNQTYNMEESISNVITQALRRKGVIQ